MVEEVAGQQDCDIWCPIKKLVLLLDKRNKCVTIHRVRTKILIQLRPQLIAIQLKV